MARRLVKQRDPLYEQGHYHGYNRGYADAINFRKNNPQCAKKKKRGKNDVANIVEAIFIGGIIATLGLVGISCSNDNKSEFKTKPNTIPSQKKVVDYTDKPMPIVRDEYWLQNHPEYLPNNRYLN